MNHRTPRSLLLLLLAFGAPPRRAGAQQPAHAPVDSVARPTAVDTLPVSPRAALFRSLAVPGWGQAYVGAPLRGGLYFALETTSLWMLYRSRAQLAQARVQEKFLQAEGKLKPTGRLGLADSRRKQVEDWITLSVFFVLFSGADAYVAAQLSDFAEHVGVLPSGDGSLRIEASVPFR